MKILSIDPGYNTGWSILEKTTDKIVLLDCGIIKKSSSYESFFKKMHIELTNIIEKFSPISSAIEKIFVNKNFKSSITLAQTRGAILLTLSINNLKIQEYTATSVKKSITGNGHSSKAEIANMLKYLITIFNTLKDLNISDAIAIGVSHLNDLINSKICR